MKKPIFSIYNILDLEMYYQKIQIGLDWKVEEDVFFRTGEVSLKCQNRLNIRRYCNFVVTLNWSKWLLECKIPYKKIGWNVKGVNKRVNS